ncbi:replicative DNA helicase [Salmonella enterica]|nr:replicative DNA helicase [Salmonella enterica]HBJ6760386.1 replicative DNA helicase [Salmonella enterica subsp. houtenae serovar 48:g,z51:-]EDJ1070613.1 replicative DNA helicase [Salmonella enterica]EIF6981518.1 replicative DNA helicase [Salmonella enterica]EIO3590844.1 replicative DNA helicase [Salmonella enterica]
MNNVEQIAPPHSISAEQAVLGGLMLNNDRWDDIATIISAERFYSRSHGVIFSAMQTLLLQNKPIDLITLAESMEQQGTLEQCGGFAYLAELSKNTPSAANIVAYAEYVTSYGQKRQLLELGHDLVGQASDVRTDLAALLDEAERRIFAIAEQQSPDGDVDLPASLENFLDRLEQRCGSEDLITGTPTGFTQLNTMTSGFQSSDLILLAGRPSMGKTALGLAFCEGALNERLDMAVQVYSLEMPTEQLLMRFTAMLGRVPLQHLRNGDMQDEDWARVSAAMKVLLEDWKDRLVIDDSSYMTPALLRSRVRKNIRKYGHPSLILLDYLQLMRCPGQENRTQEIAEISRSLKALAKEIGCPVVALSQLNRSLESRADKRPNNGDLRDSGALEQDADLIMFVYRDEVYDADTHEPGVAEIILGKQRNGPIGTIKVQYQAEITRFEDFTGGRYDF